MSRQVTSSEVMLIQHQDNVLKKHVEKSLIFERLWKSNRHELFTTNWFQYYDVDSAFIID